MDRQYIGNVGKVENGMVSVNAYGVLGDLTFPLLFKVFKPRRRLQAEDVYQTKLQLAQQIIQELLEFGFRFSLALADSFYGESHPFLGVLDELELPWIVAIRTWMVMSHLPLEPKPAEFISNLYGLRTWIEYGFKQCKNELGWADYRLTHYEQIERWWAMISSVYLMVSLQFYGLGAQPPGIVAEAQRDLLTRLQQHPDWQETKGWKRRFNNVQLLVQPSIFFCLLQPWMRLFDISTLERGFTKLMRRINSFPG